MRLLWMEAGDGMMKMRGDERVEREGKDGKG